MPSSEVHTAATPVASPVTLLLAVRAVVREAVAANCDQTGPSDSYGGHSLYVFPTEDGLVVWHPRSR